MTAGSSVADDLTQEVFVRVLQASGRYDARERERAWVFRIARNVLIDHHRRRARSVETSAPADAAVPAPQDVSVPLSSALAALPEPERDAFLLSEVGGLAYAEIAALLQSTVPAVRSRIYRARMMLRDMLSPPAPIAVGAIPRREDDD